MSLQQIFSFCTLCLAIKKKLQDRLKGLTNSSKRQSKHEYQTQIWQEFKTTIISIVSDLTGKLDNIQKHMDNISWEIKILRKEWKRNDTNKKYYKRNEELFDGFINTLETAEESIFGLEGYHNRNHQKWKSKEKEYW
jgi:hypothetical protein